VGRCTGTNGACCHDIIDRQITQIDAFDGRSARRLPAQPRPTSTAPGALEHSRRHRAGAIEIAHPAIAAAGRSFEAELPTEAMELEGDVTRLAQVLSNVLLNAAKYTPPNGRISLCVTRDSGQALIVVRDTGVGIAPEHLEQIFEMFGQVDPASQQAQSGQGIGLALTRGWFNCTAARSGRPAQVQARATSSTSGCPCARARRTCGARPGAAHHGRIPAAAHPGCR
jgi:hypothetical protein